ncbi:MAG: hypothetical protein JNM63_20040 [Spirochaetia bacterium]|nr:hypothetical protein [Spirochaetia bacterium]
MFQFVSRAAIASALLIFISSCTTGSSLFSPTSLGSVALSASAQSPSQAPGAPAFTTSPQTFTTGSVTLVQGATIQTAPLSIVSGTATATIPNLAPGAWDLTVNFYDNNGLLSYSGTKTVTVVAGQTANSSIVLTPTSGNVTLTLNLPDAGLVLWNTLGTQAELDASKVGPAITLTSGSPSFSAGKFGNGINTSQSEIPQIAAGLLPGPRGTIEFWMKPNWSSGAGIHFRLIDSPTTAFNVNIECDGTSIFLRLFDQVMIAPQSSVTITAGTWVHVAFSWNASGLDATGETVRLYINGVKVLGFFNPVNYSLLNTSDATQITAWGYNASGFIVGSVVDNLKVYSFGKINFADRTVE